MDASWRRNYLRYKSYFLNVLTQNKERSDLKAYLEIFLSLATVSVFSVFALRPTIITIAELINQIEEKKATITKMDAKIQNLSRAQNLYDRESSNIDLLIGYSIPRTANSDIFARQIEAISAKNKVAIANFKIGKGPVYTKNVERSLTAPDTTKVDRADFSVSVSAPVENYTDISAFINDFENMRSPADIQKISFGSSDIEKTANKILILTIEGHLPYLK